MMVGTRWQRTLLICLGLFLLGHVALVSATETVMPDLHLSNLVLGPSASIVRGSLLRVEAMLSLSGAPLEGNIRVEISWRRLDKQEPCGTTWETVASDSVGWTTPVEAWVDTSELIAGDYELTLSADPDNWIPESDETNNRLTASLTIRSPQPELHPTRLEAIPAIPLAWGETATLKTVIENSGDLAAGAFHVEFALLPIATTDPDTGERSDIHVTVGQSETGDLGNWVFEMATERQNLSDAVTSAPANAWIPFAVMQVPGLARDQSIELSGVLSTGESLRDLLTTAVDGGVLNASIMTPFSSDEMDRLENGNTTYAIRIVVRDLVGTAEQDGGNNALMSALSVVPSVLELPELLPVQVVFDRDLPLAWDDDVDVEVVVSNRGGSAAPGTFGTSNIAVSFSYRAQGATTWIPLETKTISQLGAEDDTNTDSVDITIDAHPNQLNLLPGSYELRVVVDEANLIPERNESNNEIIVGFSVAGTELHPISLDLPTEPVHQGDTITVVALVENTGERSQRDFTVGFYIDDARFDTFYYQAIASTEDGLEEDDRARVQGVLDTTDLPPETYAIRVVVDPDNHILEHDEGNNIIQSTLKLHPAQQRLAELHITEIAFSPTSPVATGSPLQISATLRNDGTISAEAFVVEMELLYSADGELWTTPSLDLAMLPDDEPTSESFQRSQTIYGLSRAENVVVREAFSTLGWPIGFYRLVVRVDPAVDSQSSGEIAEMDEMNNAAVASFAIGDPVDTGRDASGATPGQTLNLPNLLFQDVSLTPGSIVDVGTSITLNATVANAGVQPSGSFAVTLQWTTPTGASYTLISQRVEGLAPGETWVVPAPTIQTSLPMGPYAIIGILDTGNESLESNESDNELVIAVTVGQGEGIQPDLKPVSVRLSPSTSTVETGQEILVYTTVQNLGALAAGTFTVEVSMGSVVSRETWPGLEPLASIELVHSLGTPDPGTYALSIDVDSSEQVIESDEFNNSRSETLQVVAPEQAAVEPVISDQGAVIAMELDSATGTVTAAWSTGAIRSTDRESASRLIYDVGVPIGDMVVALGAQDTAYVSTSQGRVLAIDLSSGTLIAESESVGDSIRDLVLGESGQLYVATSSQVSQFDSGLSLLAQASVNGNIVGLGYESIRGNLYVLSTAGLFAFDPSLVPQCAVQNFAGTPSALAIGDTGVYVGTSSGVLRTFTFCQTVGASGSMMLDAWTYPRSGPGGGAVTSITIDARDVDPIYITTADGTVSSLDFTGNLLWQYARDDHGIHMIPAIDNRSGRLFYADDDGVPSILNADGSVAFAVNPQASQGATATANGIVDEVRRQTEGGVRLFRVYYFGATDGWIYKVESTR